MNSPYGTEPRGGLSPEELVLALEAARAGTFKGDLRTQQLLCSSSLSALYGIAPDEAPASFNEFLALVHPDDRERLAEDVRRALDDGGPYSGATRALSAAGALARL